MSNKGVVTYSARIAEVTNKTPNKKFLRFWRMAFLCCNSLVKTFSNVFVFCNEMVSMIVSFYFFTTKLLLSLPSSSIANDELFGSVWDSLLEVSDVSASDEKETSLDKTGVELDGDDELAWASVRGTTTKMVATIKDKEKYPNRRRR
jgi:hypothetical protein